jgi:hypothetical protein
LNNVVFNAISVSEERPLNNINIFNKRFAAFGSLASPDIDAP